MPSCTEPSVSPDVTELLARGMSSGNGKMFGEGKRQDEGAGEVERVLGRWEGGRSMSPCDSWTREKAMATEAVNVSRETWGLPASTPERGV